MFVCPVMFFAIPSAVPCASKVTFPSRQSCHVLGRPHNDAIAPLHVFYKPTRWYKLTATKICCLSTAHTH